MIRHILISLFEGDDSVLYVTFNIIWAASSEHTQNAQTQIHPAHAQSLIRAFALQWYKL